MLQVSVTECLLCRKRDKHRESLLLGSGDIGRKTLT